MKYSGYLKLTKRDKIMLASTIIVCLYWLLSQLINVYQLGWVGAVYELLWMFMLLGLFAFPVLSFIYWVKTKFSFRSLYFYSFILSVGTVLFLITS
jgi:phosphoglycerol transferase MdoB-like AlkP superfamily enzyme